MAAKGDDGSRSGPSSETQTASVITSEISSFRSPMCASPAKFSLKPGQFLHDADSTESLNSFTRRTCSMNVFSLFFDYTTVIAKDAKENCNAGEAHPMLNRFKDVRCFDKNRVKVMHPDGTHDFFHANYVDGFRERNKFILTQAPLESTSEQFWAMVFQENSVMVIALIALDGKDCHRYMPIKNGTTVSFGAYTIEHHGTQQIRETYDATILKIRHGSEPERKLLHICYFDWPDKGTPTRPTEILNLIADMNYNRRLMIEKAQKNGWLKPGTQSPIVVHCLAGVGRSGTLAALDICCRKLDYTEQQSTGPVVDVKDTVTRLRTQREMAVQNPEQYLFLHLAVIEYALRQRYYDDKEGRVIHGGAVPEISRRFVCVMQDGLSCSDIWSMQSPFGNGVLVSAELSAIAGSITQFRLLSRQPFDWYTNSRGLEFRWSKIVVLRTMVELLFILKPLLTFFLFVMLSFVTLVQCFGKKTAKMTTPATGNTPGKEGEMKEGDKKNEEKKDGEEKKNGNAEKKDEGKKEEEKKEEKKDEKKDDNKKDGEKRDDNKKEDNKKDDEKEGGNDEKKEDEKE